MYDDHHLPSSHWDIYLEYIHDLKGAARDVSVDPMDHGKSKTLVRFFSFFFFFFFFHGAKSSSKLTPDLLLLSIVHATKN